MAFTVNQFPFRSLQAAAHRQFVTAPFPFSDVLDSAGGYLFVQSSQGSYLIIPIEFRFHSMASLPAIGRRPPDPDRGWPRLLAT